MKPIYKSLVAATAAASIIAMAGASITRSKNATTTTAPSKSSTTSTAVRPGRPSPGPTPGPTPTPALAASPTLLGIRANAGSQSASTLSVTYSGSGGFLHVEQDSAALDPNPTVKSLGNGHFTVTLRSSDVIPEGAYRGTVRLRLCAETPCATELATASVPYWMTIRPVRIGEWETFQGNAGHTGHVPIVVKPALIAKKWEWQRPTAGRINAVVTEAGKVFVSEDMWFGAIASLHALSELDGSPIWRQDFTNMPALNPPAVSNGRVYVATTGHEKTFLWSFKSSDGSPMFQSAFAGQWPHVLAPTVKNGRVYTNGGYYGGGVYAYDANHGMPLWSRFSGDDDMATPAVDDGRVYYYSGIGLQVYNVANGNTIASIVDPYTPAPGYSYHAAPMLGSSDNIIAFSGGVYGGASSDIEHYDSRALVNYSLANYMARWRTAKTYKTHPAVANGVIYAGSNNPKSFDAIDEATGQVLWSWLPGPSDATEFHRNVVVTKNVAFVSTEQALYAIDLATHKPVWSSPTPGVVAISGSGTLYIAEGYRESTGRLLAFGLR